MLVGVADERGRSKEGVVESRIVRARALDQRPVSGTCRAAVREYRRLSSLGDVPEVGGEVALAT